MMTKEKDKIMANKEDTIAELTQIAFAYGITATIVRDFIEKAYDAGYNDGIAQPDIPSVTNLQKLAQLFAFFKLKDPNITLERTLWHICAADRLMVERYNYSMVTAEQHIFGLVDPLLFQDSNISRYTKFEELDQFSIVELECLEDAWGYK